MIAVTYEMVYCHHEKFDGSGYPRGLKAGQIPLEARIFAVVDVFDALSSDRPYHRKRNHEDAVKEIEKNRGTHFDPRVVDAFIRIPEAEWRRIRERIAVRSADVVTGHHDQPIGWNKYSRILVDLCSFEKE